MQNFYSEETRQFSHERFENYRHKLGLTVRKARKRLMLFPGLEKLYREFDSIVDSKYWSSKEPGISYEERKRRLKNMYKPCAPKATQLSLFSNNKILNDDI